jgi:RNA polymerase sigma factor (sigma-70 family)
MNDQSDLAQKVRAFLADKDMRLMTAPRDNQVLERYRAFLETLKIIYVNPRLLRYFDMSDIVQVTWHEASKKMELIEGLDEKGGKCYLRTMFMNNLRDEIRRIPPKTVVSLDQLQGAEGKSWCGLQKVLAAEDTSPNVRAAKEEEAMLLVSAISKLPPRQREALSLRRHGWKHREIADHLGCTIETVAGLLHRALENVPNFLPRME